MGLFVFYLILNDIYIFVIKKQDKKKEKRVKKSRSGGRRARKNKTEIVNLFTFIP